MVSWECPPGGTREGSTHEYDYKIQYGILL